MTWLVLALLVVIQWGAGAYLWRLIRRRALGWVEIGGMGLALGTAAAVLAGCLGFSLPIASPVRTWAWMLPALAAVIVWAVRRRAGRRLPPMVRLAGAEWTAIAIGLVIGVVVLIANLANYPLRWTGAWTGYHQDMVFFEALSTGTSTFAPTDSIFMAGADIRYHWLSYAWVGQLTAAAGAEPFLVLTRVLPLVALLGTLLVAVAWTRSLTRQVWAPTLAALLIVSGGYVGAVYGAILNFDSPSQALSTLWLLGLSVALLTALRGGSRWGWAAVVLVLAVAVSGGKFSSIVVAAGGFGLVTIVGLVTRAPWRRRAVLLSVVGLLGTAITYQLLVSGSAQAGGLGLWSLLDRASSVQGLNPQTTPRGIMAGTALLIVAMVARWAGAAWLVGDRRTRWQPETVLGVGMAIVGVLTIALVSGGFNDMWFALAASAPLSVLSAVGIANASAAMSADAPPGSATRLRWPLVLTFGLGAAAAVLVALIWGTGAYAVGGWRWAGPIAAVLLALVVAVTLAWMAGPGLHVRGVARVGGLFIIALVAMATFGRPLYLAVDRLMAPPVAPHDTRTYAPVSQFVPSIDHDSLASISSDQVAAAAWLRGQAQRDDLIATNVAYNPLVPAFTGLRTLISGIHYQAPYGRPDQIENLLSREAMSRAFIDTPGPDTSAALCEAGVTWVWVDPARTAVRDWMPWAQSVESKPDVVILRLLDAACPTQPAR